MSRPRQQVPAHGTRQRYQHRSQPCKTCGACKEANAKYIAGRRAARDILSHPWTEQQLPPEFLPRPVMVGCTHSLQTVGMPCSWCGKTAHTVAPIPNLVAA